MVEAEEIFELLHKARREIEVSCDSLFGIWTTTLLASAQTMRVLYSVPERDLFGPSAKDRDKDKVERKLTEFQRKMEQMFRPVVGFNFKHRRKQD
jgi:hypothetical protein